MIDKATADGPSISAGRRSFFKGLGQLGMGASFASLLGGTKLMAALSSGASMDTANQIFQAAVIAEDLATTFYYNGLVGPVIMDPALAAGGTVTNPGPDANIPNIDYLRAALNQEIQHANLLRAVGNFGSSYTVDPFKTFYFAPSTFSTLSNFIATLSALENAFIGAYLNAIREFASLATKVQPGTADGPFGGPYSAGQLEWFAEVAASIMGVECEHRVLGPVITNTNQPNNLYFESTDGLTSVYHGGSTSAVGALTPFLSSSNGSVGYSLATAVNGASTVGLASTGSYPAY